MLKAKEGGGNIKQHMYYNEHKASTGTFHLVIRVRGKKEQTSN